MILKISWQDKRDSFIETPNVDVEEGKLHYYDTDAKYLVTVGLHEVARFSLYQSGVEIK